MDLKNDEDKEMLSVYQLDTSITALESKQRVDFLNLYNERIGDEGTIYLIPKLLEYNKTVGTVKKVSLGGNDIGVEGGKHLAEFLSQDNVIQHLDLRWNVLKSAGVTELSRSLSVNTTLTYLNLEGNEIEEGCIALANALANNVSLTHLALRENLIPDSGALALASALEQAGDRCALTHLDLSSNYITEDGVKALAKTLAHNKSLRILLLNENHVLDTGAIALAEALRVNNTLVSLELRNCSIGAPGIIELCDAISKNLSIRLFQLNVKDHNIESEIACRQLQYDRPDIQISWKERGSAVQRTPAELALIVQRFGLKKILSIILKEESLEPLVDNETLLSSIIIDNVTDGEEIIEDILKNYPINGLDVLILLLNWERSREEMRLRDAGLHQQVVPMEGYDQHPHEANYFEETQEFIEEPSPNEQVPPIEIQTEGQHQSPEQAEQEKVDNVHPQGQEQIVSEQPQQQSSQPSPQSESQPPQSSPQPQSQPPPQPVEEQPKSSEQPTTQPSDTHTNESSPQNQVEQSSSQLQTQSQEEQQPTQEEESLEWSNEQYLSMEEASPLVVAICKKLPLICDLLENRVSGNQNVVGVERLKLVEFLCCLVKLNVLYILECEDLFKAFTKAWDLFFRYPMNNFLHYHVENLLYSMIEAPELRERVLTEGRILERMADVLEEECEKPIVERKGNVGHLIEISQTIQEVADSDPSLGNYVNTNERWCNFVASHLELICKEQDWESQTPFPSHNDQDMSDYSNYQQFSFSL